MIAKLLTCIALTVYSVHAQRVLIDCTFETNDCLEQDKGDTENYDWTRGQGQTPTGGTGPQSAQSGSYYMFIETSDPRRPDEQASLMTSQLNVNGDICVDFWYHMYGPHVNTLRLETQFSSNRNDRRSQWSESGDKGNTWLQLRRTVTVQFNNRIVFTATRGSDYQGDIAIDSVKITEGSCEGTSQTVNLPHSCSFENSAICNWQQRTDDTSGYDWTRQSGCTQTSSTGPCTAQSGTWYIYTEVSGRGNGDRASIETPNINYEGEVCVQFWYHMYGEAIGRLEVFTSRQGVNSPWRTVTGNQGNQWTQLQVDARLQSSDRVGFTAVRGNDNSGDVAIDNINIVTGRCSGVVTQPPVTSPPANERDLPYNCRFESDFCSMAQRTDDNLDWVRRSGGTDTQNTGPSGSNDGSWYVYVEASSPAQQGNTARLETPALRYNGEICVRFLYHMYGRSVDRLYVWTTNRGQGSPIWDQRGDKGNQWLQANVDTSISSGERIVFNTVRGSDVEADIAIDNLQISGGRCTSTPVTEPPAPTLSNNFLCNMEGDGTNDRNCRLRQDTSDNFDWIWGNGRTPSGLAFQRLINNQRVPVTGPDNAQEGTYYLYVEASRRRNGDVSRIIIDGDDTRRGGSNCLRFYYNMNGFHIGYLQVYTRIGGGNRMERWGLRGDQQTGWKRAAVELDLNGVNEIGFQATVDGFFNGDLSIDNIQLSQGRCESIPSEYVWWCNFEMNDGSSTMCNLIQDIGDTSGFDWTLWTGRTPSLFTGPDQAYNGNYYIYVEASSPRRQGDQARILLPVLNRNGDHCVEFRYHMYGFHSGSLEVFTRRGSSDTGTRWTLAGEQGNQWRNERVTVENLQSDEQIGFRGVRGTEYSSDIALDNIRLRSGRC